MIKTCRSYCVRVTYNGIDLQNHRFIYHEDEYLIGDKKHNLRLNY